MGTSRNLGRLYRASLFSDPEPRPKHPFMDLQPADEKIASGLREGRRAPGGGCTTPMRGEFGAPARQMGTGAADVADVVQETFLAAARCARQYDPARGLLWMWLCGIARRHVALHYRRQQRDGGFERRPSRRRPCARPRPAGLRTPIPGPPSILAARS